MPAGEAFIESLQQARVLPVIHPDICRPAMKGKELRLALVCYGGISLAVYMHGVTKEILKLARASKALHDIPDPAVRCDADYLAASASVRPFDTEEIYFDLLKAIGTRLDLRVIVDTIAGASAGGINSVILARALAHDLSIEPLTETWLSRADVVELLAERSRARPWSKWVLRPLIWVAGQMLRSAKDPEIASKLSLFLRSRWFKPPFDGGRLFAFLYEAMRSMGEPASPERSLIPPGQSLHLFVTLTDFFGHARPIPINSPPVVHEREHHHLLHFRHRRNGNGKPASDFGLDSLPGLAFAARATASFPGAFPPAQLNEIERFLAERGLQWPARESFLRDNFEDYRAANVDPYRTSFIDGSVVNNKPFAAVVRSIRRRPAYREVDRRIVYVDPDPEKLPPPPDGRAPGFFRTLLASLADIPRNEPIHNELAQIADFNQRVRRVRLLLESARPDIERLVAKAAGGAFDRPASIAQIHDWREAANALAAREALYAYEVYARLKIDSVLGTLVRWIAEVCGFSPGSPGAQLVAFVAKAWAAKQGIAPAPEPLTLTGEAKAAAELAPWVRFLLAFDIDFRRRRLHFVIRGLNLLYGQADDASFAGMHAHQLEGLKQRFYGCLEQLACYDTAGFIDASLQGAIQALFLKPDMARLAQNWPELGGGLGPAPIAAFESIVGKLARAIDLGGANDRVDAVFETLLGESLPPALRRELLVHYLGFAFWDVLTFLIIDGRDMEGLDEIRVDRISPPDAASTRLGAATELHGIEFGHFGAFFSRRHRENDYLWGRLNAVDRLVDIVADAAALEMADSGLDRAAFKKRAFKRIIEAEEPKMTMSQALLEGLRQAVDKP
jgi:patatin-related protein